MDKFQTGSKIKILRKNIKEIYSDMAPFIRYSAIKLEDEIGELIVGYINNHFDNTIRSITESDINDLIGFCCETDKLKCKNFIKTKEKVEFDIICAERDMSFKRYEFGDAMNTFEFTDMDIESPDIVNRMVRYSFKISDNWELIFN